MGVNLAATIMRGGCATTPGPVLDSPFAIPWPEMDFSTDLEDVMSLVKTEATADLPGAPKMKPDESYIVISSESDEEYPPASQNPDRVKTHILVRGSSSEDDV